MRLAFLLPGGEAWLQRLVKDLLPVSESLGLECVFLCEGPAQRHLGGTWIELDRLGRNPGLFRLFSHYPAPQIPAEVVEREYRYCKARYGERFSKNQVTWRYQYWMNQARALFRLIQPDQVWVWNGTLYRSAAFAFMARQLGVPVYFCEKGVMPGSWAMDPQGTNGASSLPGVSVPEIPGERIAAMRHLIRQWDGEGRSAWEQPDRLEKKECDRIRQWAGGRKIVFFPGQVDSDSNIVCFSSHFNGSLDALKFLRDNLGDEYVFLVKPHPKGAVGAEAYRQVVNQRGLVKEKLNVLDAVALSDLVVTINSTVGFEASLRGKPVFFLGRGILSGRPFVREWDGAPNLAAQVAEWLSRYGHRKEAKAREALSWAAWLHDAYYLFLEDPAGLAARMSGLVESHARPERNPCRLASTELTALLDPVDMDERLRGVSGKELIAKVLRRWLRRLPGLGNPKGKK